MKRKDICLLIAHGTEMCERTGSDVMRAGEDEVEFKNYDLRMAGMEDLDSNDPEMFANIKATAEEILKREGIEGKVYDCEKGWWYIR